MDWGYMLFMYSFNICKYHITVNSCLMLFMQCVQGVPNKIAVDLDNWYID